MTTNKGAPPGPCPRQTPPRGASGPRRGRGPVGLGRHSINDAGEAELPAPGWQFEEKLPPAASVSPGSAGGGRSSPCCRCGWTWARRGSAWRCATCRSSARPAVQFLRKVQQDLAAASSDSVFASRRARAASALLPERMVRSSWWSGILTQHHPGWQRSTERARAKKRSAAFGGVGGPWSPLAVSLSAVARPAAGRRGGLGRRRGLQIERVGLTLQLLGVAQQVRRSLSSGNMGRQPARVRRFASFGLCG